MKHKKRMIPFGCTPASWGLRGRTRDIAQAEYYLNGYELEQAILEIKKRYKDITQYQFDVAMVDLKHEHNMLSDAEKNQELQSLEYQHRLAQCDPDTQDGKLAKLDLDLEFEKITQREYDKQRAGLLDEPWVEVIDMGLHPENIQSGYFELDWNDAFVTMLQEAGIVGRSDEDIVNKWFNGICHSVLIQQQQDQDYGFTPASPGHPEPNVEYFNPDRARREQQDQKESRNLDAGDDS